jgi:hypothetical protein
MNYLMMPDQHYDVGFGAVAEAFFCTAHGLDEKERAKTFFFERLPQNFLLRHAIELFLKSGRRTGYAAFGDVNQTPLSESL